MLLIGEEKGKFYKVEDVLGSKFDLRDVRSAEKMLGIDITRDKKKNSVLQSQSGYLGNSVEEFSMDGAMANPEKKGHWSDMKWLIRYIGGPLELGLRYVKHSDQIEVEGFITSDYASDRERRKSAKTYLFQVCENCVGWKSQGVALSITVAEYMAATEEVKEEVIKVEKAPTEENQADMGTKLITLGKFKCYFDLQVFDNG